MTDAEKMDVIADIVETNQFTPETDLSDVVWDSMAKLSLISIAKTHGKTVTNDQMKGMKTIRDIMNVL